MECFVRLFSTDYSTGYTTVQVKQVLFIRVQGNVKISAIIIYILSGGKKNDS